MQATRGAFGRRGNGRVPHRGAPSPLLQRGVARGIWRPVALERTRRRFACFCRCHDAHGRGGGAARGHLKHGVLQTERNARLATPPPLQRGVAPRFPPPPLHPPLFLKATLGSVVSKTCEHKGKRARYRGTSAQYREYWASLEKVELLSCRWIGERCGFEESSTPFAHGAVACSAACETTLLPSLGGCSLPLAGDGGGGKPDQQLVWGSRWLQWSFSGRGLSLSRF